MCDRPTTNKWVKEEQALNVHLFPVMHVYILIKREDFCHRNFAAGEIKVKVKIITFGHFQPNILAND